MVFEAFGQQPSWSIYHHYIRVIGNSIPISVNDNSLSIYHHYIWVIGSYNLIIENVNSYSTTLYTKPKTENRSMNTSYRGRIMGVLIPKIAGERIMQARAIKFASDPITNWTSLRQLGTILLCETHNTEINSAALRIEWLHVQILVRDCFII